MKQNDMIIRCITTDGSMTAMAIDSTNMVYTAQQIHNCSPTAAAALGRLLTATAMMGDLLKGENSSVTLRVNGGGPVGTMIAISDSHGNCRASISYPDAEVPPKANGKLDVGALVGRNGRLDVFKDFGSGQPYSGQINLVSGEIAEDVTEYYARSEQTPTVCALGVLTDRENHQVLLAGGLLIQLLPTAEDSVIPKLEKNLETLEPVTTMMAKGMSLEEICRKALDGFEVEVLDDATVRYACTCSKEKVKAAIAMLSPKEIRDLPNETGWAEASCHYCNRKYRISTEELEELAVQRENSRKNKR